MRAATFLIVLLAALLTFGAEPIVAQERERERREERVERRDREYDRDRERYDDERRRGVRGRRTLQIPPGHLPPPGECKRWDPDLPPGHQPPPVRCEALIGVDLGDDLIVTHTGAVYDPDWDWEDVARRDPDSVPGWLIEILRRRP